jgi:predicted nuclease of predicted toxin-antitoxin system
MAQLYADENFNLAVVQQLRLPGHDVLTVQDAGQQGGNDVQVLAYAIASGRAVLTFDRPDFIRLHSQVRPHCGIIVCTNDDAIVLADRIHQALLGCPVLDNQLLRINRPP